MNFKHTLLIITNVLSFTFVFSQEIGKIFTEEYLKTTVEKVCDWQFQNLYTETPLSDGRTEDVPETGWIRGVFYTGVMAAYRITEEERYLDSAYYWGEKNRWQLGERKTHADDQVVVQTYADLFMYYQHSQMLEPAMHTLNNMLENPQPGKVVGWSARKNWSWCDALYMAPPAITKIGVIKEKPEFLYLMNTMWWETCHHLYSQADSLFYRDERFVIKPDGSGRRTENGHKVFWGRGNGWVLAGLAKTLEWLPKDFSTREAYEKVFVEMAAKIASLQHDDGLWRSSLYDFEEFPVPEASSSGFFCYALAWGINNGYLNKEEFLPIVKKAWKGLNNVLQDSGKVGYVQPVGHDPRSVTKDDFMEYGAAAFILTAEQMLVLIRNNKL